MLETVRSVGSLGSAPTLVESKDGSGVREWKSMSLDSPTLSPVMPLSPVRIRGWEEDEDRILPYPTRRS
jgi:hypothetical protein